MSGIAARGRALVSGQDVGAATFIGPVGAGPVPRALIDADHAGHDRSILPQRSEWEPLMHSERKAGLLLRSAAYGALAFLHLPVLLIFIYAFSADGNSYQFPPSGLTTHWFEVALTRTEAWDALWLSVKVAAYATLIALVLGAMAAGAIDQGMAFLGKLHRCCPSEPAGCAGYYNGNLDELLDALVTAKQSERLQQVK